MSQYVPTKIQKIPLLRKEWEDIFLEKIHLAQKLENVHEKRVTILFFVHTDSLLGRICNPTAISMSICNAENGKRKRIINPYTKCCRITNTAERGKCRTKHLLGRICNPTAISMSICNAENGKRKRIINPYTKCCRITNTAERSTSITCCS